MKPLPRQYRQVVVENFRSSPTGNVHTRPLPGQGHPINLRVETPSGLKSEPVGKPFRIWAKLTRQKGGRPYLRSHAKWPYEPAESPERVYDSAQVLFDIEITRRTVRNVTMRKALIDARLGQGQFRSDVELRWSGRCAATGCQIAAVLRASHIKPWSECTNSERLDPSNGLLLAAHIDALFDRGLISFQNDGSVLISPRVPMHECKRLRLPQRLWRKPTREEKRFLKFHRNSRFLKE